MSFKGNVWPPFQKNIVPTQSINSKEDLSKKSIYIMLSIWPLKGISDCLSRKILRAFQGTLFLSNNSLEAFFNNKQFSERVGCGIPVWKGEFSDQKIKVNYILRPLWQVTLGNNAVGLSSSLEVTEKTWTTPSLGKCTISCGLCKKLRALPWRPLQDDNNSCTTAKLSKPNGNISTPTWN